MKIAISVEDEFLRMADRAAHQMCVSRSRLFSMALQEFLRSQKDPAGIVEGLKLAYFDDPSEEERTLTKQFKTKLRFRLDRW